MPSSKMSREISAADRKNVFDRDGGKCARCGAPLTRSTAKVDLIRPSLPPDKRLSNLRLLFRRCDVLRLRPGGQPNIAAALEAGIIGPDWRGETWEDLPDTGGGRF